MNFIERLLQESEAEIAQLRADKEKAQAVAETYLVAKEAKAALIAALRDRAKKAEKACSVKDAALRGVLESCVHPDVAVRAVMVDLKPIRAALSPCGQGYVSRDELSPIIERIQGICNDVKQGGCLGDMLQEQIDLLQKLMDPPAAAGKTAAHTAAPET